MKNKDVPSKSENVNDQKKTPAIKKLQDKIGPVQNDPNWKQYSKNSKKDNRAKTSDTRDTK